MSEHSALIEINADGKIVTFTENGEYLVTGGSDGVRVLRVEDGEEIAKMQAEYITCLAVSKDGRWIAAGSLSCRLFVWDAKTYEKVFEHRETGNINGVDFSPEGLSRLVIASDNGAATIWDVATRKLLASLPHEGQRLRAAKYSPQGDRIATASKDSIRVWDSNGVHLLVDVPAAVDAGYNGGLLWFNDHLFVVSGNNIKRIDSSTGSTVSEWLVPGPINSSCIALPQHGEFIAYSTIRTVTFWDTSTHSQLGLIQFTEEVRSIALSPDDRFLAMSGYSQKITTKSLYYIAEPDIQIHDTALDSWKHDDLLEAETSLTAAIPKFENSNPHVLACRALVRSRLQQWDASIVDAEKSLKIQPSVFGYIAKSIALVGVGERHAGYRTCDIAFEHCHSNHVTFLLLVKAIIVFMAGEHHDAISRVDDIIATLGFNSMCYVVQAYMHLLLGNSHMESKNYEDAIRWFERAQARMRYCVRHRLLAISLISGWKFDDLGITIRQRLCEALYVAGRTKEAGEFLLEIANSVNEEVSTTGPITEWVSDFTQRCLSATHSDGNTASRTARHDEMPMLYATLNFKTLMRLLQEWTRATLATDSWRDALIAAATFMVPRFMIYRALCEHLETTNHVIDARECVFQLMDELGGQTTMQDDWAEWVLGKLMDFGDAAMKAEQHDDAIRQYSAALSLHPAAPQGLLIKRSRAYVAMGSWEDALNDANKVIVLDPSSPWGHERKHAALHKAGDYENAIGAFEMMLSKMSQSSDLEIRECHHKYVTPAQTRATIRRAIEDVIRESPRVLINTVSGRLCNKSEQFAAFESLPVFKELISSMTTHIDHARIEHDVTEYYRYATFSHTWEDNEPLFEKVLHIAVYELEKSLTHDKLQMFCKIVQDAGFNWAWSDTCCINKADHFVFQEALVAMFKWYEGSALTIIFLRGVLSPSRRGDLVRSIWNTRAWTFQEYHASKVVRFYTEDWKLYMNLDISNHKESPEIISEMEEATGIPAQALMALRPGLNDIRRKLCLASRRETTFVEDSAYSLLGIFSISLPIVYGERDKALGRLLGQLLMNSGDTSILAWTGKSGPFNSCLPANITVFNRLPTTHIPPATESTEMDLLGGRLQPPSLILTLVMKLYDQLSVLPVPSFTGQRMKLPCITFVLEPISASRSRLEYILYAQTASLGIVKIRTREDLSRLNSIYLIHPWIDFLLDRQPVGSTMETVSEELESTDDMDLSWLISESPLSPDPSDITPARKPSRASRLAARLGRPFSGRPAPSQVDKQKQALRVLARLRQPFGALLLTPDLGGVAAYRRVATESLITVQVLEEITPTILNKLIDDVRILDVL